MDPVYEAGGDEAEGLELAEADLIESAHGDSFGTPDEHLGVREWPELAAYGEPDEEDVTEVVVDRREGSDDPAACLGIAADR